MIKIGINRGGLCRQTTVALGLGRQSQEYCFYFQASQIYVKILGFVEIQTNVMSPIDLLINQSTNQLAQVIDYCSLIYDSEHAFLSDLENSLLQAIYNHLHESKVHLGGHVRLQNVKNCQEEPKSYGWILIKETHGLWRVIFVFHSCPRPRLSSFLILGFVKSNTGTVFSFGDSRSPQSTMLSLDEGPPLPCSAQQSLHPLSKVLQIHCFPYCFHSFASVKPTSFSFSSTTASQ